MSDRPRESSATYALLHTGYVGGAVASTVGFVRDGDRLVVTDPGMVRDRGMILDPLRDLGVEPGDVTDVVFSHPSPTSWSRATARPSTRRRPRRAEQHRTRPCFIKPRRRRPWHAERRPDAKGWFTSRAGGGHSARSDAGCRGLFHRPPSWCSRTNGLMKQPPKAAGPGGVVSGSWGARSGPVPRRAPSGRSARRRRSPPPCGARCRAPGRWNRRRWIPGAAPPRGR